MKKLLGLVLVLSCLISCVQEQEKTSVDEKKSTKKELISNKVEFTLKVNLPKSINNQKVVLYPAVGKNVDQAFYTYKPVGDSLEVQVRLPKEDVYQLKIGSRVGIPIIAVKDEKVIELNILNNALELDYEVVRSKQTKLFKEYMDNFTVGNFNVYEKVKFLETNSPSFATANIYVFELLGFGFLYADQLNHIRDKFKDVSFGKNVVETIDEMTIGSLGYGKQVPQFELTSINGIDKLGPSSFRGKYLMLDFWASWCGPCRGENPNVKKAYTKYKHKGFEVLGVSTDRTRQPWIGAVKKDGITWPQVRDDKGLVSQRYSIRSIPSVFLINPQGKIVGKNVRGEALEVALKYFLDK